MEEAACGEADGRGGIEGNGGYLQCHLFVLFFNLPLNGASALLDGSFFFLSHMRFFFD